jgi:hypothetical protein
MRRFPGIDGVDTIMNGIPGIKSPIIQLELSGIK